MDPMRRRLTVSQCAEAAPPAHQKGKGKGSEDVAKLLGLEEVLKAAADEKKRAIAVVSRTDELKEKKRAFSPKEELAAHLPGSSPEEQAATKSWLQSTVGWACHKGKKPEQANQDCMSILVVEDDFALYGVYDGHGPLGHYVSEYACSNLPHMFLSMCREEGQTPDKAFHNAFQSIQKLIEKESVDKRIDAEMSGSTCTMAYHCMKSQRLWLAHVGDSRSIIGSGDGKACEPLTIDHKPDLPEEKKRIESANPPGRVIFDGFFNHRVFAKSGMYPGLNMSRALGDCVAHRMAGLTAMPDIKEVDLANSTVGGAGERLLILCTDGVWEFINDEEALSCAYGALTAAKGAEALTTGISALTKLGYDRWLADSDDEISDDITGVMVRIPLRSPAS